MESKKQDSKHGFTVIELMIVVVIIGILAMIAVPNFVNMREEAKNARVKENCHTLQLAVENYAVQNNGAYPLTITNAPQPDYGPTLINLLPDSTLLCNPFTKEYTEPRTWDGTNYDIVAKPGMILYEPKVENGVCFGYTIHGCGQGRYDSVEEIITLSDSFYGN